MKSKEIINETNKEIFSEIETHLLFDEKPSIYLNQIINEEYIKGTCFKLLSELKDIPQNPRFHPEGNVWVHTLNVVDEAAKYKLSAKNIKAFMWAALLHDIGKIKTTLIEKDGQIIDYNHHIVSSEMSIRLFRDGCDDRKLRNSTIALIKHHMTPLYLLKRIASTNVYNMIEDANISDVALLSLCNKLGKGDLPLVTKKATLLAINDFLDIMSERTGVSFDRLDITF